MSNVITPESVRHINQAQLTNSVRLLLSKQRNPDRMEKKPGRKLLFLTDFEDFRKLFMYIDRIIRSSCI